MKLVQNVMNVGSLSAEVSSYGVFLLSIYILVNIHC